MASGSTRREAITASSASISWGGSFSALPVSTTIYACSSRTHAGPSGPTTQPYHPGDSGMGLVYFACVLRLFLVRGCGFGDLLGRGDLRRPSQGLHASVDAGAGVLRALFPRP